MLPNSEPLQHSAASLAAAAPAWDFERELMEILSPAFGYALRLTRNRADAEDLVQEASLNACRARGSFEPGTNFKAWFFRILTRCFWARHRRATRRIQQVDLDDSHELYLYIRSSEHHLSTEGPDPAAALFQRLDTEQVTAALEQLPEEFRVVCTLYFMDDLPYQEIASVLEIPVGTVRSRLHRGRRMLQKALWVVASDAGIVQQLTAEEAR
jgi:RNA polymerase sigma-70 factor (ECF subfamily)